MPACLVATSVTCISGPMRPKPSVDAAMEKTNFMFSSEMLKSAVDS